MKESLREIDNTYCKLKNRMLELQYQENDIVSRKSELQQVIYEIESTMERMKGEEQKC